MRLGPQIYIDLKEEMRVCARYINDCRCADGYNVTFEKRPGKQTNLDIPP
jgi:hypothetical protein